MLIGLSAGRPELGRGRVDVRLVMDDEAHEVVMHHQLRFAEVKVVFGGGQRGILGAIGPLDPCDSNLGLIRALVAL